MAEQNEKTIYKIFRNFHNSIEDIDDNFVDSLLGIEEKAFEKKVDQKKLREEKGFEQYRYEGTPYNFIRYFLKTLNPEKGMILYDLGSGYGRVPLYGAITTPANYKGIEITPSRVEASKEIAKRFDIKNVCFECENVITSDFSDGDIFFLFNPFYPETLSKVGEKLKKVAENKPVRIVTWGGPSNDYFEEQEWLVEIPHLGGEYDRLQFFYSK